LESNLKITAIRNRLMRVQRQNWHFVEVETDDGMVGVGEASLEWRECAVAAAVDELSRLLIGQDSNKIEHHWQRMHRHGFWRGGVVLGSAISGIDQALWDLKGKRLGVPVYELFGGPTRDRVRLYTHVGGTTPEAAAEHARELVGRGFTALKMGVPRAAAAADERALLRSTVARVQAVRDAVGPEVDLMLDNHGQLAPGDAIELGRALAPFGLLFFEEPVPPDSPDALAKVATAQLPLRLATGERLFSKWDYKPVLQAGMVDVVQPDICHAGGLTELRKIAAMAEASYIKVAPHNPNGPVATIASVHLAASIPNFLILEMAHQPLRDEIQRYGLTINNGWAELPRRPGLGIELDPDVIAAHPYAPGDYESAFYSDGSVADI
jgi:galactonate dehydratase